MSDVNYQQSHTLGLQKARELAKRVGIPIVPGTEGGITDFRLTGGGTKSDGFAQIMTDVIGMPSTVTRERECRSR